MTKKILICYLFTSYDNKKSLINFINHYRANSSGITHTLLICFKLINKKKIISLRSLLKNIKYVEFIDPVLLNDYDFGSYKRVSKNYPSKIIFFLNSHSYPLKKNWLKTIFKHYKKNTVIGTSASCESLLSSIKIKKIYMFFSFIKKFLKYRNKFKSFPNPHIRTSSFLIKGSDFFSFVKNKKFYSKEDTWSAESGFDSLTNFFKKKKYNTIVVNSDGKKFNEKNWKFSETYNYLDQSKSLISDKHSRKYLKLSTKDRFLSSLVSWG